MKLNEMSNALQERYQLEQDKKRKEEDRWATGGEKRE